jgi:hypothetical protein
MTSLVPELFGERVGDINRAVGKVQRDLGSRRRSLEL